jgi:hypothetical protein
VRLRQLHAVQDVEPVSVGALQRRAPGRIRWTRSVCATPPPTTA